MAVTVEADKVDVAVFAKFNFSKLITVFNCRIDFIGGEKQIDLIVAFGRSFASRATDSFTGFGVNIEYVCGEEIL